MVIKCLSKPIYKGNYPDFAFSEHSYCWSRGSIPYPHICSIHLLAQTKYSQNKYSILFLKFDQLALLKGKILSPSISPIYLSLGHSENITQLFTLISPHTKLNVLPHRLSAVSINYPHNCPWQYSDSSSTFGSSGCEPNSWSLFCQTWNSRSWKSKEKIGWRLNWGCSSFFLSAFESLFRRHNRMEG